VAVQEVDDRVEKFREFQDTRGDAVDSDCGICAHG
jgi:hypothetical protein